MRKILLVIINIILSCSIFGLNKVHDIRVWKQPDGIRVVFDLDEKADYSKIILQNPSRLVIDLNNIKSLNNLLKNKITSTPKVSNLLSQTRYGYYKSIDKLRVVFDLKQNINNIDYKMFKLNPTTIHSYRLVIDLSLKEPKKEAYTPSALKKKFVVAIDAGHGGEDPGAIGPRGTYEKNVTYRIAQYLFNYLKTYKDIEPVLIRKGDYYVGLRNRIQLARKYNANLFVSIHADGFTDKSVHGASVFTLSDKGATSELARWLADSENNADLLGGVNLDDKDDMLAHVLLDLSQTATKKYSVDLAKLVLNNLKDIAALHKKHVEQAGFLVLKSPDIPSILVETGFISNPIGEKKLNSINFQKTMAKNLAYSIYNYFTKYEKNNLLNNQFNSDIIQAKGSIANKLSANF